MRLTARRNQWTVVVAAAMGIGGAMGGRTAGVGKWEERGGARINECLFW